MRSLTVAAAQIRSGDDPVANLALVRAAVRAAASAGARLVVLPEAAMARFGSPLRALAEGLDGPFAAGVRAAARASGVWVVAGMFTPAGDRVRNTLLITDGDAVHRYDKIHLYDAFGARESEHVEPGAELVTLPIDGVRVGFATCYDVRFAAHFTRLGRLGAEVICLPASWGDGEGKAEQWDVLVRARAMDAQAWLVASDQAWQRNGDNACGIGASMIASPLGARAGALGREPELLVRTLDLGAVDDARRHVPILSPRPDDDAGD